MVVIKYYVIDIVSIQIANKGLRFLREIKDFRLLHESEALNRTSVFVAHMALAD